MNKSDNPGHAFLAELERDAHRYTEEARADQAFFDQADNEDLRHETANTGQLLEIAEDDGDTEKAAVLARSYERHLAEQRRRAAEPYDPYADAKRAEKAAADADDEWDRNPNPQTAQASRDAGQAADEAWRRAGRPDCIPPAPTVESTEEWKPPWLDDAPDLTQLSPGALSDLTMRTGDLIDECRRQGDSPERIAAIEHQYERYREAHREAAAASLVRQVDAAQQQAADATTDEGRRRAEATAEIKQRSLERTRDLADSRTGRWYDTDPITTTSTESTGGAGMSSIDEVRGGIAMANENANEGLGMVQQALSSLETAQGAFMQAIQGTGQADGEETAGMLARAIETLGEGVQQISAAIQGGEDVAGRL